MAILLGLVELALFMADMRYEIKVQTGKMLPTHQNKKVFRLSLNREI